MKDTTHKRAAFALGLLLATAAPAAAQAPGQSGAYDTTGNVAFPGNGHAQPAVASSQAFVPAHQAVFANDGVYGNPSAWIGESENAYVQIDLGQSVAVDEVTYGRDRAGIFSDRAPGNVTVLISTDDVTYTPVAFDFVGGWDPAATRSVAIDLQPARYVRLQVEWFGACIDEVEVHGAPVVGETDVDMACFNVCDMKVEFGCRPGDDEFQIEGNFTLGVASDGVDLATDAVTVEVGTHSVTVPAGSFVKVRRTVNTWKLATPHDGLRECVLDLRANKYMASARCLDLSGTANPVRVALKIGDDVGTETTRGRGRLVK